MSSFSTATNAVSSRRFHANVACLGRAITLYLRSFAWEYDKELERRKNGTCLAQESL
jgi:hypothetical protein